MVASAVGGSIASLLGIGGLTRVPFGLLELTFFLVAICFFGQTGHGLSGA